MFVREGDKVKLNGDLKKKMFEKHCTVCMLENC